MPYFALFILILTLFGHPAPDSVGMLELTLVIVSAFATTYGYFYTSARCGYRTNLHGLKILKLATTLFFILMIGSMIGTFSGTSFQASTRSLVPYIIFMPLCFLCVGLDESKIFNKIYIIILIVGIGHAIYLLTLFFGSKIILGDVNEIVLNRITLLDPRTTLPFFLAAAILPLGLLAGRSFGPVSFLLFVIAIAGFMGGIITQTRAQVVSAVVGSGVFWWALRKIACFRIKKSSSARRRLLMVFVIVASLIVVWYIFGNVFQAMTQRVQQTDDNGRIEDEWIPALSAWLQSGPLGILFGIGPGHPFTTLEGDQRTYIHNVCIYFLVYGGVLGLLVYLSMHFLIFVSFIKNAVARQDPKFAALAGLLAGMFVYASLFAVHKLLSYNILLFLLANIAIGWSRKSPLEPRN